MKLKEPFYVVSIKYPVTLVHVTVQGQTIQAPKLIEHLLYARDLGGGANLDNASFWLAN